MFRVLSLLSLLCLVLVVPPADADAAAALPEYREVELEKRWQAEQIPTRAPSAEQEELARGRAGEAARNRDSDAMVQAARDIVAHAPDGISAGWQKAAAAWTSLSRSSHRFASDANRDWDARQQAYRTADNALREAAFSLYAAYRTMSDPDTAAQALDAFSVIQNAREEYVSAELALRESLAVREDSGARARLNRIRNENGFRIMKRAVTRTARSYGLGRFLIH